LVNRLYHIIRKDLVVEKRENYSFIAAILYLAIISFIVFKLFPDMQRPTRAGFYWIMLMFTSVIVVGDSFDMNALRRKLSHYQLYNSSEYIFAKLIWNYTKMWFSAIALLGLFALFASKGYHDIGKLILLISLALMGIVGTLTLVSSMVTYANARSGLTAILAFPLLLPILLISMKLNLVFERFITDTSYSNDLFMLLGINILVLTLTLIFFSFTWKQ